MNRDVGDFASMPAPAAQGISQRQLALMTGISRSHPWKIETGAADIGIEVLIRIARALDVQVRNLIEF